MPRTPPEFLQWTYDILGTDETLTARKILDELERRAERNGLQDRLPDERTVLNYKKKWKELAPEVRRGYESFLWPKSLENNPDLPWDASRPLLELVAYLHRLAYPPPNVRVAKWYWRLWLVAAGTDIGSLWESARYLAALEVAAPSDLAGQYRRVMYYLAHAPWRSDEAEKQYKEAAKPLSKEQMEAIKQAREAEAGSFSLRLPVGTDVDAVLRAIEAAAPLPFDQAGLETIRNAMMKHPNGFEITIGVEYPEDPEPSDSTEEATE